MRAAVLRQFSQPYDITEVAPPSPGTADCLVRVRAVGICGTDLKISTGAFQDTPLPIILGHEVAGELVEDAGGMKRGQRVALHVSHPCGVCRWCLVGEETLCPDPPRIGFNRDGGLAEFIAVPATSALPFNDTVPFEQAAVGMDAILSPYRALLVRARVQMGESVIVVGAGGLGLSAVQIARAAGARVAAIDPLESHRQEALNSGAELAVDPADARRLIDWSGGGADVVYEASGRREGLDTASLVITKGGRLICNGWAPDVEYGQQSRQLVLDEITLLGSRSGTRADIRGVLRALEQNQVRLATEVVGLDDINEVMARLRAGDVVGRFVVAMGS